MRLEGLPALALLCGSVLGAGVFLVMSVWAWPRARRSVRSGSQPGTKDRNSGRSRMATVIGVSVLVGVMTGALAFALTGMVGLAGVSALAAAFLPTLLLARAAQKERRAMRTLWPDVVDSLVAAVRSGASLPAAVSSLTAASPRIVHEAAEAFERQFRQSGNFDACINVVKATWADPAADRIVETLRLGRHVGGSDVTTILRGLGGYLRQESAIRQEVEARQGWIRTAARIGVAAPWVVLTLLSTRPEAAAAYNSPSGVTVILIGLGVTVVAYRMMLAVGVLPEPRRWMA